MMSSSRPMRAHMAAILLCCYGAKCGSAIMVTRGADKSSAGVEYGGVIGDARM